MTMFALVLCAVVGPLSPEAQTAATPVPQQAPQTSRPAPVDLEAPVILEDVTVRSRPRGSVIGDAEPEIVLDQDQIRALGAGNIAELLEAIQPMTQSNRGRSDAPPVLLVNGRRISGFQEIQGLPSEAIERTEILSEEVALSYGYRADQRVVNFVLKREFRAVTLQADTRLPTRGGRTSTVQTGSLFRITGASRWNLDLGYEADSALYETERDIARVSNLPYSRAGTVTGLPFGTEIDPALSAQAGFTVYQAGVPSGAAGGAPGLTDFVGTAGQVSSADLTAYRTLQPSRRQETVRGSITRDLDDTTTGTVSLGLVNSSTRSLLGLPGVTLTLPGYSPFSPFADDTLLYRYIDRPGALTRESDVLTGNLGTVVSGFLGDWRWTLTGTYDRIETRTHTGRGLDAEALQARLSAGDPAINPFATLPDSLLTPNPVDTANSISSTASGELVLTGTLWEGPAGGLTATLKAGGDRRSLNSTSVRSSVLTEVDRSRDRGDVQGSFSLPLASRDRGVLAGVGDLSANFNFGYESLSDFGGLATVGGGLTWSPLTPLSFVVSYTSEAGAPSISQLNDPTLQTPNVPVFDFATGETVSVTRVDGGNPGLLADSRQVVKLGVTLRPLQGTDLSISSNYTRSRIADQVATFPTITPDLEQAFPERFVRDGTGRLLSIDARPINFAAADRQDLRTGFNFSRAFGRPTPPPAAAPAGAAPAGSGRPATFAVRSAPGGGGGRGMAMQPGQGRFSLSVFHTWRLQDAVTIRDGLPVLDLLDGASVSGRGGQPRQEVQVMGGVFRNGMGAFLNGTWRDATRVDGGAGGQDLFFSDQAIVNLNLFADLSARAEWVARWPVLKGARVNLGVRNLFDSRLDVRDASGQTPLGYQPDYLDPSGRIVSISLRKQF
ncbi:MAG: TonB-dependent receptor [Brevundimonas sp.]